MPEMSEVIRWLQNLRASEIRVTKNSRGKYFWSKLTVRVDLSALKMCAVPLYLRSNSYAFEI